MNFHEWFHLVKTNPTVERINLQRLERELTAEQMETVRYLMWLAYGAANEKRDAA